MLLLDQVVHIDADNADVITMLMKRKPSEVAHNVDIVESTFAVTPNLILEPCHTYVVVMTMLMQ